MAVWVHTPHTPISCYATLGAEPLPDGHYDDHYVDPNGRRPGEDGFLPLRWLGRKGQLRRGRDPDGLAEGCYDLDYCDAAGRQVGDRGFRPRRAFGISKCIFC